MAPGRWRTPGLVTVLGLGLAACPGVGSRDAGLAAKDAGARAALRPGIRVPLPSGWTALVTSDGNLKAGPSGRPVLEIIREPGAASDFPTPENLRSAFAGALRTLSVRSDETVHGEDFVGVTLTLRASLPDGGQHEPRVGLGARRLASDLYLCSTSPGSSTAEVSAALKSCSEIVSAPSE